MWLLVFAGPLSTLPAVIASFFCPKTGGIWLISGAVLSSFMLIFQMSPGAYDFLRYLLTISFPMVLLGLASLFRSINGNTKVQ